MIDRFSDHGPITAGMAYRRSLPLAVTEKLVNLVSEEVRRHLVDNHQLSPETALRVSLGARERATVDLVDQAARTADLAAFCAHLNRQQRLNASLLLRAVAQGQVAFFEWALAELAGVPHHRAWLLVHDAGALGLKALYERAKLPPRLYGAFRCGIDAHHSLQAEGADRDPRRFQQRMLERFLTQATSAPKEDVDYLLDRLDRLDRSIRESPVAVQGTARNARDRAAPLPPDPMRTSPPAACRARRPATMLRPMTTSSDGPPVRPAATLLMLRDDPAVPGADGARGHHQIDFAGGALVFPRRQGRAGGRRSVWPRLTPWILRSRTTPPAIAAVREAFEESGVLLAVDAVRSHQCPSGRLR